MKGKKIRKRSMIAVFTVLMYLISVVYPGGIYSAQNEMATFTGAYWDGIDSYGNLNDVLVSLGSVDKEGYYHITEAVQLHAVIKYNGGGNKYRLDNDLYLNSGYENYESWGSTPPENVWDFTGHTGNVPKYKFYGTIDGVGHTIYGLYSGNGYYAGLIGGVNGKTCIENLNVEYSYIRASKYAGVIIGGNWYDKDVNADITVKRCSVKNAYIYNVWNNGAAGGLIGLTTLPTVITDCAVANIKYTSCANATDSNGTGCFGSFIGGFYSGTSANVSEYNKWQGKRLSIKNSYAVNTIITDKVGNTAMAYVCGLFQENSSKWCFCITANNVYTDSDNISSSYDETVKLLVSSDGTAAISPLADDYPIKTINADSIKGSPAKTVMAALDWCRWKTVENGYPIPQGSHKLVHTPVSAATCTKSGAEEYWTCMECNRKFIDAAGTNQIDNIGIIDALNHRNAQHFEESPNSCVLDGNIEYWYCPDCGKYSTDAGFAAVCLGTAVIIPKTNHKSQLIHYSAANVSCEEDGHIEYWHCTACDRYYMDEACLNEVMKKEIVTEKASGHRNPVFHPATVAGNTCFDSGTVAYWECSECHKNFKDRECTQELYTVEAPSDKHFSKKINGQDATCYKSGILTHFECIYCHKYFEDGECKKQTTLSKLSVSATGHMGTVEFVSAIPAGCSTIGIKEHWYCKACDSFFIGSGLSDSEKAEYSNLILQPSGHKTDADSQKTFDTKKHWQLCEICGEILGTEPHKLSDPVAVADGYEKRCECGYVLKQFSITQAGVSVFTDYGALNAKNKIGISVLQSGIVYNRAVSALPGVKEIKVYDISVYKGLLKIMLNGRITIKFPIPKSYSGKVSVYSISEDGTAEKLNAEIDRVNSVATVSLYTTGDFAVVDAGVKNIIADGGASHDGGNTSEIPKTGESNRVIMFVVVMIVAGFVLVTYASYNALNVFKYQNEECKR